MALINRQAAIDALGEQPMVWTDSDYELGRQNQYDSDVSAIQNVPTIDAVPVVHAKWIFSPNDSEGACTNCNFKIYGRPYQNTYLIVPYNYCPNCGAKMDGGEE